MIEGPITITDGIAGCGSLTNITAGRHTVIPEDMHCYIRLEIGSFTSIAGGLKIVSGQHPCIEHPEVLATFPFEEWDAFRGLGYPPSKHDGRCYIGHDVWIGQDVHILEGVTIGNGAVVGACSVVTKDVEPYAVVVGNPATHKRYRLPVEVMIPLQHMSWWHWSDEQIRTRMDVLAGKREIMGLHYE